MTLKFLFVTRDNFPPFRVDVKILFGKEMVKHGHTIDWLLQSRDNCKSSYQTTWSNCRVWVGAMDTGTSRLCKLKKHIHGLLHDFKILSLARKRNYDFIQVKDKFISPLIAIIASKICGPKFIYWLSFPFPESALNISKQRLTKYPLFYLINGILTKFLLYRIIMPNAHHIFVQSEQMKKDIISIGIPAKKITPVPMGVSLKAIPDSLIKNSSRFNNNQKMVLYLGSIEKVRRIDYLIHAFKKVLDQEPEAKLYIVGGSDDPKDELMLKNKAEDLGIIHAVIFTGHLPIQDAWNYVANSNVCVSYIYPAPQFNAASPTKLIEYMAMAKPVVANDHPEHRLVISESKAGICIPFHDEAFAGAIIELLNNPQKAFDMGIRGRMYVKKHRTYKVLVDIVEKEYCHIQNQSLDTKIKDRSK